MCGILLMAQGLQVDAPEFDEQGVAGFPVGAVDELRASTGMQRRGPDNWGNEKIVLGAGVDLQIQGSLLQLRGAEPCTTPAKDDHGNVLVLNGEIFGGLAVEPGTNDSQALLQALAAGQTLDIFNALRGPWAMVYWHAPSLTLWFGRDVIGRRSLLVHWPQAASDAFCLVSAVTALPLKESGLGFAPDALAQGSKSASLPYMQHSLQELPPGLYSIQVSSAAAPQQVQLQTHPWRDPLLRCIADFQRPAALISPLPKPASCASSDPAAAAVDRASSCSDAGGATTAETTATSPGATAAQTSGGGAADCQAAASVATGHQPAAADVCREHSSPSHQGHGRAVPAMSTAGPGLGSAISFEQATHLTLRALAHSVATRCQCIDQHTPCRHGQAKTDAGRCSSGTHQCCPHNAEQNSPGLTGSPHAQRQHPSRPPAAPRAAAVLVLFSGGVDSTLIAALAHQSLPPGVPIDLASVCFNSGKSADRRAAEDAVLELACFAPGREWRLIKVDASLAEVDQHHHWLTGLLHPAATVMDLNIAAALWLAAQAEGEVTVVQSRLHSKLSAQGRQFRRPRQQQQQQQQQMPVQDSAAADNFRLDQHETSVEQRLSDQQCAASPLLHPRTGCLQHHGDSSQSSAASAAVDSSVDPSMSSSALAQGASAEPDATERCRATSAGAQPIRDQAAGRLQVSSVPLHAVEGHAAVGDNTQASTAACMSVAAACQDEAQDQTGPSVSVQSIGGHEVTSTSYSWYRSAARVVLLGHGADEQHAGYGRHRTSFRNGGWHGLQQELAIDMQRLWLRNLGRDDRLIADTSREARHPFLDEHYIQSVLQLPLWQVADLTEAPGAGDKKLLRAALQVLGLARAACRVKRAVQFGSGIGKLSNVRNFGSNRAANSKNAGSLSLSSLT